MAALKKSEEEIVRLRSDDDIEVYRHALSGHGPKHEAVIEVDRDDDLTSLRSKLESTPLPRAVVVIEPKAKSLREGIEFRVLRRLQRELGLDIVIISPDMNRRGMAKENGFPMVYSSLRAYYRSKDSGADRVVGTLFTGPEEFTPSVGIGKWGLAIGLALAAILIGVAYMALPVATVTVYPESQVLARDVEILVETGGPQIDVTAQRLAGRVAEQRVQVQGTIRVGEVPPAPGALGGSQAGDTITLQVRDALHDRLLAQAREQLNQRLRAELKASESLPEQSIRYEIIGERYNHSVGDAASELSGYLEVVGSGIVFSNDQFNRLVFSLWSQDVPKNFHAVGTPNLTPPAVISSEGQHMTLRVKATGRVERNVDTDAVANAARWQSPDEAAAAVSRTGSYTRPPRVELWPDWASRAFRVQVRTAVDSQPPNAQSQQPVAGR